MPRWYYITWILGRPPDLTERQWRVLGLVALVSLFEMYDLYLFSLNLSQIQKDLEIAEADLGFLGAMVRAGSLLAIPMTLAADRFGRRRMLLVTIVGYTALTGATALAPNATTFVVFQTLARGFATAETILAVVVIVEEFAPENRGWGIGALGAIQAMGAGLASFAFMFVDVLPFGWRALYFIGLGPLILIAYWRRTLPETRQFELHAADRADDDLSFATMIQPMIDLARQNTARLAALAAAVAVLSISLSPAMFLAPKYLQDVHNWTPQSVGLLTFFAGAFAVVANPLAGWLSDRHGRRPVAAIFAAFLAFATIGFYQAAGVVIPLFWVFLLFGGMGCGVMLNAFGAEMFPTSQRSTASGIRHASSTLGDVSGLALLSILFGVMGSNYAAATLLVTASLLVPFIVYGAFPETAGRNLSALSSDNEEKSEET
jgi:AAHS family benzoate transporter-like MFS transporter